MAQSYIHGTKEEEQERLSALNAITNRSFLKYLDVHNVERVCDFGCGLGNLISDIAICNPGTKITGIEISQEQFDKATENLAGHANVTLKNVDIFACDLPDDYFDVTYCRYVLEHVADPQGAVREMIRVTKKGGRIVCQENDLHNVIYYPPIPGHDEVMKAFCHLQVEMQGDPYIGRKLFSIFQEAGAKGISLSYEPEIYTEEDPEPYKAWMSNSWNIFQGAKQELLGRRLIAEKTFEAVSDGLYNRIRMPHGVALFHWNRVTAIKC